MSLADRERLLIRVFLILLGLLTWLEARSPTAADLRSHKAWTAWLALSEPGGDPAKPPLMILLSYPWDRRMLYLLPMPETSASRMAYRKRGDQGLADYFNGQIQPWEGTRLLIRWFSSPLEISDAEGLRHKILDVTQGPGFWLRLPGFIQRLRRSGNPSPRTYDLLLLAREATQLNASRVRSHVSPSPRELPELLARIENSLNVKPASGPIPVSVLNASGEPGVALQARKVLRWRGLDVVDFGNAASISPSTRLVDHAPGSDDAESVARLLGCGDIEISDAIDSGRSERVTIVLGQDFGRCTLLSRIWKKP